MFPLLFWGILLIFCCAKWREVYHRKDWYYGCGVPCRRRVHSEDKGHIAMVHKQTGMEGLTPSYTHTHKNNNKKKRYGEKNITPWPVLSEVSPLEPVPPAWWHPGSPPPGSRDGLVQTQHRFYLVLCCSCSSFSRMQWAVQKCFLGSWKRRRWVLQYYLKYFQETLLM